MRWIGSLIYACSLAFRAWAQEPVTLTINAESPGYEIPADFAGVSIFTGTQVWDHKGVPGNLFSGANTQLITLFKNAGLRHLRLGATGSARSGGAEATRSKALRQCRSETRSASPSRRSL